MSTLYEIDIEMTYPGSSPQTQGLAATVTEPEPAALFGPQADANGTSAAIVGVSTDQTRGEVFAVATNSSVAPQASQIVAGKDANGLDVDWGGTKAVKSTFVQFYPSGLRIATDYWFHFVQRVNGVLSNVSSSGKITTADDIQQPYPGPTAPTVDDAVLEIDAENYDTGGEGVAYHDASAGQHDPQAVDGGRTGTDVDHTPIGSIGWTAPGEWIEYTFNVATAGEFDLTVMMAAKTNGNRFDLHVYRVGEDTPYRSFTQIPTVNTGAYDDFTEILCGRADLDAGANRLRIYFHDADQDISAFRIKPVASSGGGTPGGGGATVAYSEDFTTDVVTGGTFENDSNTVVASDASHPFTFPNNGDQAGALVHTGDNFSGTDMYYVPGVPLTNGDAYSVKFAASCHNDAGESETVRVRLVADNGTTQETIADSGEVKVTRGEIIIDLVAGAYTCGIDGAELKVHSWINNGRSGKRKNMIHLVELSTV